MILNVEHITTYRYDRPVRGVVQSHRLQPSLYDGQRVQSWDVTVTDGQRGGGFRDGAGDWVQAWSVLGPVSEIAVTVRGTVETFDTAGMLRGLRDTVPPEAYLRETVATRLDAGLTELSLAAQGASGPLDAAHRLSAAVTAAITYRPGVTEAHTIAAEALAKGEGVCQDHAQAMIAIARANSLPARYVSGYLHTEDADHEAAHAWAEVFVAGLGWIGFDPANECCPDDRYIRLGSGLDAQDAAPIRGTARGPGAESLKVAVAVQSVQQ